MKKLLFIILLFTGYIYSQQVEPLVADTNSSGVYDVNHIKILGTKNDATHHRMPVDVGGATINATITGMSTSANQVKLYSLDSLIQLRVKALADSIINRIHMNSATLPFYNSITNFSTNNSYAQNFTTTGTTIVSVVFSFTPHSITFINDGVPTDSLFVSSNKTFPSTNKITRLGGEGFTKSWAFTKLYFKVGTTPLVSKKIRIEAL